MRKKKMCRFIALCIISPLLLLYKKCPKQIKNNLFTGISQVLALFPGKTGSFLRIAFYSAALPDFSQDIHMDFGSYLSHPEVIVGKNVSIGSYCVIGKCSIGADTIIGSGVHILSGNQQHRFSDSNTLIRMQTGVFTPITIGQDCWIGSNVTLLADIKSHCVIGAGSVVTKPLPTCSVAAGNPCKFIKNTN